jgi:aspartate/methionine/tyrosine aminotransferase
VRVSRLRDIPGIGVDRLGDLADAAGDPSILRLENLDTDLRPPIAALEATRAAVDDDNANSYLPFPGSASARRAAAAHVSRAAGREYDWRTECVITAGGLNGITNALLATLEPGDEVILTDPIYAGLINRVRLAGGVTRFVPLVPGQGGWTLDVGALRAAVSSRTRVVLAMSPSMPTGHVLTEDDWRAVAEVVESTGAWLLYDAAMERILYDGRSVLHPASIDGLREKTITVGSVSKELRMIGWRVGWVVGPAEVVADIGLVGLTNVVCQVGIAQAAAAAALTATEDGVAASVAEWQRRRDTLLTELGDLPAVVPHGGWSLLLNATALGHDASGMSSLLFEHARIAATPMLGWGPEAERYVRFVFANEPCERLVGAGERIRSALETSRA